MNTLSRLHAAALAVVLTSAMLLGVDTLASVDDTAAPQLARSTQAQGANGHS